MLVCHDSLVLILGSVLLPSALKPKAPGTCMKDAYLFDPSTQSEAYPTLSRPDRSPVVIFYHVAVPTGWLGSHLLKKYLTTLFKTLQSHQLV